MLDILSVQFIPAAVGKQHETSDATDVTREPRACRFAVRPLHQVT